MNNYIVNLNQVSRQDLSSVGGKNANLGEMIQNLGNLGIEIPGGFAVTVSAFDDFISENNFKEEIEKSISKIDWNDWLSLKKAGTHIRQIIRNGDFSNEVTKSISIAYKELCSQYGQGMIDVAVRSSAVAEDQPDASFAGQQDTYLNIRGAQSVLQAVRNCFASLYTDRAISYRNEFGYDHFTGLSVCIQKMVRSDMASSGVAFSLDTESGFSKVVLINGSYGLGEMVVQGSVSPDEFIVFKPTLKEGFSPIIEKKLGNKDRKMVYDDDSDKTTTVVGVSQEFQNKFCINDEHILTIAKWVVKIEEYYTKQNGGKWMPMDIEWAVDGLTEKLFIVQARPETIHSRKAVDNIVDYSIESGHEAKRICEGVAVGDKLASGKVKILYSLDSRDGSLGAAEFNEGDVLVTSITDPDWEPIMKKASAIVTNKGGRTCHAAIVAREMGVPAIVGTGDATTVLKIGQEVTVSCAEGSSGYVYDGVVPHTITETNLSDIPSVKTPVMLNVASPEMAFKFAHLPNAGVGLAREEFIINNYIKVHPLALINHATLEDKDLKSSIDELIKGFDTPENFFISKLSYGVSKIASAFFPNKVIVRFSDFKSNEYFNMLGGKYYEPKEENPMIGWRGCSRYYSESYKEAFGLECIAIKKVREEMGLNNVVVMLPFCRTVEELKKVLAVMEEYGLKRGEGGLEVYLMAELPSNIILADEFSKHIDGFSIGSNDLTQLTLGLDRDSSLVQYLYDERNEAVKKSISNLIKTAKANKVKVGICGQGPSDFPDFAEFLVEEGIDSISVTPDSLLKTVRTIDKLENK